MIENGGYLPKRNREQLTVGCITNLTPPFYPMGGIVNTENLRKVGDSDGQGEVIIPLTSLSSLKMMMINTESIKGRIFEYFNKRTEEGTKEYGHTIDDAPDSKFDWRLEMIEELVDCVQYAYKEIARLEKLLSPADEA